MDQWLEKNESQGEAFKMETAVVERLLLCRCPHACPRASAVSIPWEPGRDADSCCTKSTPALNKLPRGSRGLLDSKSHEDADFVLFTAVSQHLEQSLVNSRRSVSIQGLNECF